ncbi:beta strand repeat-containing protein [Dactylosporangium sp. CS-033363]|uniref:beta strand repeat-containing protein n=1 Tax=Dactylosporangium sp. CS-033363 TaxID=3239935 RepID=UPI003D8AA569
MVLGLLFGLIGAPAIAVAAGPGILESGGPTIDSIYSSKIATSNPGPEFILRGSNLASVTEVRSNGVAIAGNTWAIQSGEIVVTPTGAQPAGTDEVYTVADGSNTTVGSAASTVHWLAAPVVSAVSPSSGSELGGTSVTITGTGFTLVDDVTFGAVSGSNISVDSSTQITVTAPAGAAGNVDVVVSISDVNMGASFEKLESATSPASQYTYVAAPTVTSLAPTSGTDAGGATVIITGSGFTGVSGPSGVTFGGTNATGYTVDSDTQITATAPAHAAGAVPVVVTSSGGGSNTTVQFTYVASNTAPAVTTQPQSQTKTDGQPVSFTAAASGTPTPTVQWQSKTPAGSWTNIGGATSTTYMSTAALGDDGTQYRAVFSNSVSSATSNAATLTVQTLPSVTTDPQSQTKNDGDTVTFTAAASGNPAPTVEWFSKQGNNAWTVMPAETSTTLSFTVSASDDGMQYRAEFTNAAGSVQSNAATLTVTAAPAVVLQPQAQTKNAGQSVTFTAAASGTPAPTVKWQSKAGTGAWTDIAGATSDSYTFTTAAADDAKQYRAVYSNGIGTAATSNAVTLTVHFAPTVTTAPQSQTKNAGQSATFTAAATGNPAPTVQWQSKTTGGNWADINGETGLSYTLATPAAGDDGTQFRAVFTNTVGTIQSAAATLTITDAPVVSTQPQAQTANAGDPVTFTAAASGTPTPTVQWQSKVGTGSWTNINGATNATYTFTAAAGDDGKQYRATFDNGIGTAATTSAVTLTVHFGPAVTTDPQPQSKNVGQQASFTAAASGNPAPTVQWESKTGNGAWTAISGATSLTYAFTVTAGDDAKQYRAVFTNTVTAVNSAAATLTVAAPPTAPASVSVVAGTSSITVSWPAATANGSPVTGYVATAVPGPATCTTDGALTCVLGATAGTTYTVTVVAKSAAGDSAPSAPSAEATPTAPEPPAAPPQTNLQLTTDQGAISSASPGQEITFIGTGFAPYSTAIITIYSTPTVLGTAVTDATGSFSKLVTIPPGLDTGDHTAVAQGVAPDGTVRAMSLAITVAPSVGGDSSLPVTGPAFAMMLATGLGLTTSGAALIAATTRRRRRA